MRRHTERGFSLLEMLAVVAILLILGAMASPTLLRAIRRYRIESTVRQMGQILVQTRYEAMRQNRPISTVFNPGPGGMWGAGGELGIDYNRNSALDAGEPRAMVNPNLLFWVWSGGMCCPQWVQWPDYTGVQVGAPLTFGPDGTLLQDAGGGAWQIATSSQGVWMENWPDPSIWSDLANRYERYIISVTPAGRVRVWRFSMTSGYQAMQ